MKGQDWIDCETTILATDSMSLSDWPVCVDLKIGFGDVLEW